MIPKYESDKNTTTIRTNYNPKTESELGTNVTLKLRSQRLQPNKKFEFMQVKKSDDMEDQKTKSHKKDGREDSTNLKKKIEEFKKKTQSLRQDAERRNSKFGGVKKSGESNKEIEDDSKRADEVMAKIYSQRAQSNWLNLKLKTKQSKLQQQKEKYENEAEKTIQALKLDTKSDDDTIKRKIGDIDKRRQQYMNKLQQQAASVIAAAEKAKARRVTISAQISAREKLAAEKAAAKRIAIEKAAEERDAAERANAKRLVAERAAAVKIIEEERAAKKKSIAERAAAKRIVEERATAKRIAAEKEAVTKRIAAERAKKRATEKKAAAMRANGKKNEDETRTTGVRVTTENNENVKGEIDRADAIISNLSEQRAQSNWFLLKMKTKQSKIQEQNELNAKEKENKTDGGEIAVSNGGSILKKKIEELEKRRQSFRLNKEKRNNDTFTKNEKSRVEDDEIIAHDEYINDDSERAEAIMAKIRAQKAQSNWLKIRMQTKKMKIQQQKENYEKEAEQRFQAMKLQIESDDDAVKQRIEDIEKRRNEFLNKLQQRASEEAEAAEKAMAQRAAAEKAAAEKAMAQRAAAEKAAAEKAAAERAAAEKAAAEEAAAEKFAAEIAAAEKAAIERTVVEKITAEKAGAYKIAKENAAADEKKRREEKAITKIPTDTNFVVSKKKMRKVVKRSKSAVLDASKQRSQVNDFSGSLLNIGAKMRRRSALFQKDNDEKDVILKNLNYRIAKANERTEEWSRIMNKKLINQIRNQTDRCK